MKDLREQLAVVSGDVDRHVEVLAENLRGAHRYIEIVKVLRAAGRAGDAREWARRGLAAHPGDFRNSTLRDLRSTSCLGRIVAVRRCGYAARRMRCAPCNRTLRRCGRPLSRQAPGRSLQPWALDLLRRRVAGNSVYLNELIGVLLDEDLVEEAWQTAISRGEVSESRWMQLVEIREISSPADVIRPYQELVEHRLASTDKYRYDKVIKLLRRLRDAHRRSSDLAGFADYLADLRDRHRRKTSFIAKLDKAGLKP